MIRRTATFALFAAAASIAAAQTFPTTMLASPRATTTTTSSTTSAPTTLPSAAEVISRYVAVTGGPEGYAAVHSRRASGTFALPDLGINGTESILLRDDGHALITIDVPGIGVVKQGLTDGIVWSIHPTDGPKVLSGVEAETTRRSFALAPETTLDGYRSADVVGVADVNGRPAFEMRLVSDGDVRETRFYDTETGLLVKSTAIVPSDAGELNVTTFYTDYEDVPPVRLPMKVRQTMSGVSPEQTLTKVENNVELPDALFALPPEIVALQKQQAATRAAGGAAK